MCFVALMFEFYCTALTSDLLLPIFIRSHMKNTRYNEENFSQHATATLLYRSLTVPPLLQHLDRHHQCFINVAITTIIIYIVIIIGTTFVSNDVEVGLT